MPSTLPVAGAALPTSITRSLGNTTTLRPRSLLPVRSFSNTPVVPQVVSKTPAAV